jgi:hypothetical protein
MLGLFVDVIVFDRGDTGVMTAATDAATAGAAADEVKLHAAAMIPPVRTGPGWGRAQYGPVQPLGWTGPSPRLAVWDWMGLVWTSPHTLAISTLFLSKVPLKT